MKLTFLGATGTVTGSRYLVEGAGLRVLVGCGLFQGTRDLRLRNWAPFPVATNTLDAVILTHAHPDHCGYLPVLVRTGYRGPVYCTSATRKLCDVMLRDSGMQQEEEADFANRHGCSKHQPALPLYTLNDAEKALRLLVPCEFDVPTTLNEHTIFRLLPAGHIVGAATAVLCMSGKVIAISADLGHPNDPIIRAPMPLAHADYLVIDSTYGDRLRAPVDPAAELAEIFASTFRRGGVVVIPCFVPEGALSILHYIACLKKIGEMAEVPVFLDSPMASDFMCLYRHQFGEHRLTTEQASAISKAATAVSTVAGSKAITSRRGPMVVVAGSGMATSGRVLHHLKAFASDSRNTIVLVGYQAPGTRGAALEAHASTLRIHGEGIPVRAAVKTITSLSAHADYCDLLAWLGKMSDAPDRTFITHGAAAASDALRVQIQGQLHWRCDVPAYLESVTLPERHEEGASPAPRNRPRSVSATGHPDRSDRPVAVS